MAKYATEAATAVLGLAGFEMYRSYRECAPSLAELRASDPDDIVMRQQLLDADIMIGGIAVTLGVAFAVLSHDGTALAVMLVIFGLVSFWHRQVLTAGKVTK